MIFEPGAWHGGNAKASQAVSETSNRKVKPSKPPERVYIRDNYYVREQSCGVLGFGGARNTEYGDQFSISSFGKTLPHSPP